MPDLTFHIITFGCQMNVHDSQWLAAMLKKRGFVEAEIGRASVVIINTCSVREKPEQKVRTAIGRIRRLTGGDKNVLTAVMGCAAQQLGPKLYDNAPQVRLLAGTDGVCHMPDAIEKLLDNPDERMEFLDFSRDYIERDHSEENYPGRSAFISIMQGCDNFCSYCIVPFTRGRQKSRSREAIITESRGLLAKGVVDLTLLGQNVNAWGKDHHGEGGKFSRLLHDVASLGLARLRFITPHPADMDMETVEAFKQLPNLCPRLHLPMQSGSDSILKKMRRRYQRKDYMRLVEALKKARPELALSTDIIVGFPGETEADFNDTLEMMKSCEFMSSFSFCYSDRPGTRSALMPDKIETAVKRERLASLQELQDKLETRWLSGRIGQKALVLLENPSLKNDSDKNFWQGRDPYGSVINVNMQKSGDYTGQLVEVEIRQASRHSLKGVLSRTIA